MKLTAYTIAGPWRMWEDVDLWALDGPQLIIWRGHTKGSMAREVVNLPRGVIGLADDSPSRHTSDSRAGQYRPDPNKLERQGRPRGDDHAGHFHMDGRARFGDSPRRRQFRGDGS